MTYSTISCGGKIHFSSHLVSFDQTTNYTLHLSHLLISLALSEFLWIHAFAWILPAEYYHIFSPTSYAPRARTALSHEFLLECRERCSRVLMMGSLPSNSTISPHLSQLRENSLRTTSAFRMELTEGPPSKISVRNDIQSIGSE